MSLAMDVAGASMAVMGAKQRGGGGGASLMQAECRAGRQGPTALLAGRLRSGLERRGVRAGRRAGRCLTFLKRW